jgi:formyl-CoA transferase
MMEEENQAARTAALSEGLAKLTTQEAYRRMIDAEVPAAPILTHLEVLVDPQITHNGSVLEAVHPVYGRYRRVRQAARFSRTQQETTPPAALYGEHSDEILDEIGCSDEARERLRELGALT